jgi:HAD superfamily hydrolase (TIGR01509 family)
VDRKLRLEAVIFDMDGLLIDTETLVRVTWRQAATDCGLDLDDALFLSLVGRTRRDTHEILQSAFGDDFALDTFVARCTARWEACIAETGIPLKPGARELLDRLDEIDMPRAVATSTGREGAVRSLELAGVLDRFPHLVTGDQVERGKPAPDIFLRAASLLGVEPARCLVLEDSPYGVMAAHAAGMVPVMVPDLVAPTDEIARLAYAVLGSLDEVWPIIRS